MPQLSLYLDDPMMEGLRQDASREGKTLSKFVAGVLKDHAENNRWPHGSSTCTRLRGRRAGRAARRAFRSRSHSRSGAGVAMYLLDSCICIDFLRGRLPYAYDLMRNSDPRLFKIPAIVEGELLVGVEKSSRPEKARWLVDEFTLPFDVLPFDSDCAREYGRIRALLERSGKKIGHNDLFIAATALANNAVLVTNNMDEFKRVPGLSLECWYEMKWEG